MRFIYQNLKGEVSEQVLTKWVEDGKYIKGYSETDGAVRTFLIFRIQEYLDGSESLLQSPFQLPPEKPGAEKKIEILFTGFPSVQRTHLETLASNAGMKVVKTPTNGLTYLVVGPNAGPTKVSAARAMGVFILSEPNFKEMLSSGELPDSEPDFI